MIEIGAPVKPGGPCYIMAGFCDKIPSAADLDLWLRLARIGEVLCVPKVHMDYLMHRPGNMSGKTDVRLRGLQMIRYRHECFVR